MDIEGSTDLELYIEISNLLISFLMKEKSRLLILDLPFATLIFGKMPIIMLVPQSICPLRLSMIISTAQKVISGPLGSYSMKCSQATLPGRPRQKQISKDKSRPFQ